MHVTETLKRAYERVTGHRPSTRQARAAVIRRRVKTF
jgi:hypothetical protein